MFVPSLLSLPKLTTSDAKNVAWEAFASAFRNRFLRGKFKQIGCRRIEREKVKCKVFWYYAGKVYTGGITTYLSLPKEGSLVHVRFRIKRYDAACWVYSAHPRSCPRKLFFY